jgi:hypothetical protein
MRIRIVLVPVVVLLGSMFATADTLYENGPQGIHENYGAPSFSGNRNFVSNTFTVSGGNSTISGIMIWTWGWPSDHNPTAELTITSQANSGTVYFDQVIQFSESSCYADGFGFSHCHQTASLTNGPALINGTYWVNLKNGSVPSGNEIFWDGNNGVGCQSPGCPSQAQYLFGTVPSESFTLTGTGGGGARGTTPTNPKTSSIFLFGSGFAGLMGMMRRMIG